MSPSQRIKCATEPHRVWLGYASIVVASIMFISVVVVGGMVDHNRGLMNNSMDALATVIKGMANLDDKPAVVYIYVGGELEGTLLNWPKSAEELLGWTWEDIEGGGLEIIMPVEEREPHKAYVANAISKPWKQGTHAIEVDALHKDGRAIPVTVVVWVTGDENCKTVSGIMQARKSNG